jgi:hypothetical protein
MFQTLLVITSLTCGQVVDSPQPFSSLAQATQSEPNDAKTDQQLEAAAENPTPSQPKEETPAAPTAAQPDRWFLMKYLQGTYPGNVMYNNRMQIWGWTTMSFTPSSSNVDNNLPVTWTDRANRFLVNQHWTRIERPVITSGTTEPTWGYRFDFLFGTDYRWTLPRGLWNSQLENSRGNVNLYGVDMISSYLEYYVPTFFQGLDIKVGRFFTPFGYESLETISSPLVSKSYSFNWFPPFTHFGALATCVFNPMWKAQAGIINGNDVWIGDPSERPRFLGTLTYTSPNLRDVVTLGTSLGKGGIGSGDTYNPATYGLMSEPAGRANFNAFDLVWTHVINPRMNYALEADYAYQYGVPSNVPGGIIRGNGLSGPGATGTAHWGGLAQYLIVNLSPKVQQITRFELWDDTDGQRTGFVGLYVSPTAGIVYKPYPWLMFRQELRYDYNGASTPFDNGTRHDLVTAAMDLTVRW